MHDGEVDRAIRPNMLVAAALSRSPLSQSQRQGVVAKDKRITARHTRELEQSGTTHISVPEDFLVGRVVLAPTNP